MTNIKTITLGCRFNYYESEVEKANIKPKHPDENFVIINTCSITQEAERKSKQAVRKAIKTYPNSKIIVTGCAAKTALQYFSQLDGIYKIIQNDEKAIFNTNEKYSEQDYLFRSRARAFLQIQNGCNNFCTYCIVPFTRGRSTSLSIQNILDRVQYFEDHGFKEIVLSGIDITSYGIDLAKNIELADVIEEILNQKSIPRIRISSIDPFGVSKKLLHLFSTEQRIMPHFHFSIQSGDNMVLKAMKRRHNRELVINLCKELKSKRPNVIFGADFIAGFPTETEKMFDNSVKLIDDAELSLMHIFPFSPRQGTIAATMIQLSRRTIYDRAQILREKANDALQKILSSIIGQKVTCLVEKSNNGLSFGKTDSFLPILIEKQIATSKILQNCQVIEVKNNFLLVKS